MERLLSLGSVLLGGALVSATAATVAALSSLRSELSVRDGWNAGSNLWLEPERYLRPNRVGVVRILNWASALLGVAGLIALAAAAVWGWHEVSGGR